MIAKQITKRLEEAYLAFVCQELAFGEPPQNVSFGNLLDPRATSPLRMDLTTESKRQTTIAKLPREAQ